MIPDYLNSNPRSVSIKFFGVKGAVKILKFSKRFDLINLDRNLQQKPNVMKSNLEYFTPWMMEDEFYNLENGIQTFLIPKTGDYKLTLAGFGFQTNRACQIVIHRRLQLGQKLQFFIRSGTFLFVNGKTLVAVAGGAGYSKNKIRQSSASLRLVFKQFSYII